ncbi:Uncharacterised protein [Klebsiella pneumoniae]|nr:Uncharacterised protein [Klebsiella pneumoniae]SLV06486.1 Uncharacterised protein [Klebsiella pneumoniae]SLV12782.1 Uncharacterised protein [Klebsiella pneumoniae]SLV19118.1 Uncharacterised protein [Klebsiella pneumoniae]SLY01973.1 Uncharacterised protein [Klebsiella pneumoniae]
MQSMLATSGTHARSAPSVTASGCVKHGQPWATKTAAVSTGKANFAKGMSAQLRGFTALAASRDQVITACGLFPMTPTGNHIPKSTSSKEHGARQSICRAGPAAFCWKSPMCALSGCSPLPLGISAKRLDAVFMIFDLPLMVSRYGRSCGNPSMAPKTGKPTPGFGSFRLSALKVVQHEQSLSR